MERILTIKEYNFVKEFIGLIEKYNIMFSTDGKARIEIIVQEKEGDLRTSFLKPPLRLGDCFDQIELYEVLNQTEERIKHIAEEYKSEEIFTQHLDK